MFKLSLLASAIALSTSLVAETDTPDVERVVVYGTLDQTPLSQTATSISVLDQQVITERQAQHLEAVLNRAANVNFATGASRGRFVQIRGIGERSQFVDPVNPSVGFLVDGIDYSGLMAGASTFDVAQVEIFKGPNSARFGAEGLAGMINVITEQADDEFAGAFEGGVANYGSAHLGLAVTGGLSESVKGRFSIHSNRSDGFINNIHLGRDDTNNIDEITLRGKLNWQASDDLKIGLVLHDIDVDNGYDAFSLDQNRDTLSDNPGFDTQDSTAFAVTADYRGFKQFDVSLKLTDLDADLGYGYDEDWSFEGIHPIGYASTDHYLRDHQDSSFEVQLKSKDLRWIVGAYFADEDEQLVREYTWLDASFNSQVKTEDTALFAKYKMPIDQQRWFDFSVRLAEQSFAYSDSYGLSQQIDESSWGGELSYHQMFSDNAMFYASLQRAFKMGGINSDALSKAAQFPQLAEKYATFAPEYLIGTEVGVKGQTADGAIRYTLSAFYQQREDVQYKNWLNEGVQFVGFVNNAADGDNLGVELETVMAVSDAAELFLNLGLLSTELNGITREQDDQAVDISGREQAHAPSYQLNFGYRHSFDNGLSASIESDFKDRYYYSYSHDQESDNIVLLHASVTYQIGDWTINGFVRNLTDETYGTRGFYFGNDPRAGYASTLYQQFGEPRRVGVSFKTRF